MDLMALDFLVSLILWIRYLVLRKKAENLATKEAIRLHISYAEFKKRADEDYLSPDYSYLSFRVGVNFAFAIVFLLFGVAWVITFWW